MATLTQELHTLTDNYMKGRIDKKTFRERREALREEGRKAGYLHDVEVPTG